MNQISLLMVIVRRDWEEGFVSLLRENQVQPVFSLPAQGTATPSLLNLLGLERQDKTLLLCMAVRRRAARLMRRMVTEMGINISGTGIALSLPVGIIGGQSSLNYFMRPQNDENGEVDQMEEKRAYPFDLILAIAQQGYAEMVMDMARKAGAGGGTVVHAKGLGEEYAEKFLGLSIAAEKEMILIVTRHEQKDAIMRAIMDGAGAHSQAHTVLFSLPVEDVVGLRSIMKEAEEEE